MSFFKSIETLFHKINEWNETQKELARQRQSLIEQKYKERLEKLQRYKEAKQQFIQKITFGIIKPHNHSSKNLTTQNNGLEVKMFTVFPDSANQTPSPFEEMYYANHEE
ncbi:hypothetical protein [Clostridium sp. MD294]|uniref:hypothetical protein n=1 Tax=Clostridium sp. MD294 TaxID=97138 RepID=UPI0002CB70FD|nr:hypothetical protein [Clostridium sp. MD294]NDO45502.1 hypothetical protein [Clostridium sp. MD294]USF30846.1 hypothetical protein C820_002290 [Clostridium sp. MD294]